MPYADVTESFQIASDQSRGLEMPDLKEVGFCVQIEIVYT